MQLHNSVRTGAMNRSPTPTECTLHIIHAYQRLPTYIHCRGRFIVPAYYGMYGVDNRVQPMFYPRTPTVIRGCNLHNSVWTGAINRPLRLRNVRCGLFTYTHCREPIYRARISWNTRCGLSTHTNVYLRTPYILKCGSRAICTNKMWWYYVS